MMIADLDETIRKLIQAEMPIKNGEVEVTFDQPKREWSARLSRPTINFFLYDLCENMKLRQHLWEQVPKNGQEANQFHHKRSPFRVDCLYMLTAWAHDPEDEHRLLSRCLLALFRFPLLPGEYLMGSLQNQPFEIPARLASRDESTNPAEMWHSLDNEIRPSISYIITLAFDPWAEVSGPLVRTLTLRSGIAQAPAKSNRLFAESGSKNRDFGGESPNQAKGGADAADH